MIRLVNLIPSHDLPEAVKNESMSRLLQGSASGRRTCTGSPSTRRCRLFRATRSIPVSCVPSRWAQSGQRCTSSYSTRQRRVQPEVVDHQLLELRPPLRVRRRSAELLDHVMDSRPGRQRWAPSPGCRRHAIDRHPLKWCGQWRASEVGERTSFVGWVSQLVLARSTAGRRRTAVGSP